MPDVANRKKASPTIVIAMCITALLVLSLCAGVFAVGDRLASVSSVLAGFYYVVVAVLVSAGIVAPLLWVVAHPIFSLARLHGDDGHARMMWCRRLVSNLERTDSLTEEERATVRSYLQEGDQADDLLAAFFKDKFEPLIDQETKHAAKTAFFATAVSQSSIVDALSVLSVGFNLVRSIVQTCGFRPSNAALVRLYIRILAGALVAGSLEEADFDEMIAGALGGGAGSHASGILLASVSQGMVNALVMYRIGVVTKRYLCCEDSSATIVSLRQGSIREAYATMRDSGFVGEVLATVRNAAGEAADAATTAARQTAANVGKAAYESVTTAASVVGNVVRSRLGKTSAQE